MLFAVFTVKLTSQGTAELKLTVNVAFPFCSIIVLSLIDKVGIGVTVTVLVVVAFGQPPVPATV